VNIATNEARSERIVTHERAREAAQRLINSHFNNNPITHPHARTPCFDAYERWTGWRSPHPMWTTFLDGWNAALDAVKAELIADQTTSSADCGEAEDYASKICDPLREGER